MGLKVPLLFMYNLLFVEVWNMFISNKKLKNKKKYKKLVEIPKASVIKDA